jgi:uncharacterized iron-regulated membrane protein
MRGLDLLHRWAGGLIGLLLVVLGASGALLLHQDAWLRATLPHAADPPVADPQRLPQVLGRIFAETTDRPTGVLLAGPDLGVHRLFFADRQAGAYVDQNGQIVARWTSLWARPEVWLFELHHHLLARPVGGLVAGWAGLAGVGFVVSGAILWWRTRRSFAPPLLPRKLTRPFLLRHHRDLGIVLAPLLLLSFVTGAMMNLKPLEAWLLKPLSPAADIVRANAPPTTSGGALPAAPDWTGMLAQARRRFPDAEPRWIGLPTKPGGLIVMRLRQPSELTPNGRTTLWFDPADGRLVGMQDARLRPLALRVSDLEYPLHAAKVGGLLWRLVLTLSGLGLTILGAIAIGTFWFGRSGLGNARSKYARPRRRAAIRSSGCKQNRRV